MEAIRVEGTQLQLAARIALEVVAMEPSPETPPKVPGGESVFDTYPANPNGYVPIAILTPQVPVAEFNGPPS